MFTDEQLKYIYEAVKHSRQYCVFRTLSNGQHAITLRESDKERIEKYNEIIDVINKATDNKYAQPNK